MRGVTILGVYGEAFTKKPKKNWGWYCGVYYSCISLMHGGKKNYKLFTAPPRRRAHGGLDPVVFSQFDQIAHSALSSVLEMKGSSMSLMARSPQRMLFGGEE